MIQQTFAECRHDVEVWEAGLSNELNVLFRLLRLSCRYVCRKSVTLPLQHDKMAVSQVVHTSRALGRNLLRATEDEALIAFEWE